MFQWDFGIIDTIKKELECRIFPSIPPEDMRQTPYIILELKNILPGKNLVSRVDFMLTIVDDKELTGKCYEVFRTINKIISKELTLSQGEVKLGSGRFKINSIEGKKNNLILNLTGILQMEALYED